MIKKRLLELISDAKKHVIKSVIWQWLGLLTQIIIICIFAGLMEQSVNERITAKAVVSGGVVIISLLVIRMVIDRQSMNQSYEASATVKEVLRDKIYEKLLRLGAGYNNSVNTSAVVQMASEGVEQLETYFGKYLPQLIYSMLAPITLFIFLMNISISTSIVLLVFVPLIPLSIVLVQKYAKKLLSKYWGAYENLGDSFLENLQGLTTLKIYGVDENAAKKMDEEAQHFRKITMKVLTMQLNSTSVMDIMAYGGAATGIIIGGLQYLNGTIGLAQVLIIILLASEFFIPLRRLGSYFHIAMNGMEASDRIFELLDCEEPPKGDKKLRDRIETVTLNNVSFGYSAEKQVLNNISFSTGSKDKMGCMIALVGQSGCGKSTIVSLLMKRIRGYEGNIKINGIELKDISEDSLFSRVTEVSVGSYVFAGTIREHLKMGTPLADEKKMMEVLKQVKLWDEIKNRGGLDEIIAEHGSNFSGGQLQRLALARALLRDSDMYYFDEATSNIDAESEEIIMEVIHELSQRKLVVLISHRLSNVVNSDMIYLLNDGAIAECGNHSQLMNNQGDYYNLFTNQKKLEEYGRNSING